MSDVGGSWSDQIIERLGLFFYGLSMAIGAFGGYFLSRAKFKADKHTEDLQESAAQITAVTQRFQTLIDGYEKRVADLTIEVQMLRAEIVALRGQLEEMNRQPGVSGWHMSGEGR